MDDGPIPAGRGIVPGHIAEIIVALEDPPGRRGSGYRVGPGAVLTAAHIVEGAASVRARFDADLPGEWTAEVISCWTDPRSDLAVLTVAPREGEPAVAVPRFGRIGGDRAAVLAVQAVGFPRFKLKSDDGVEDHPQRYRDSHQADGSVAVLSNRREGTLEITVLPPGRDPDPGLSPWEGMSGAAVWVGDRIVGVIAKHHRSDGLGRLAAARLDLVLEGLDPGRSAELRTLLGLPDLLPDVVPPSAGERVRTAYQAQVRDIAPDRLLDRDAELDELVAFCAGDQPYAWWQAEPWAGKSALMSWFVLHPPAGVDVVSFFVTARLAGQSDSDACTDALIEQLAALVGESPAGLLTAGARRGTMLQLLDEAAGRAREAGRRLLLVIDGLDEDSGGATGLSIAALLPRRPPSEVRVLVASRPHPPIPDDIADNHPLRTMTLRQLDVSEHARDVERRAKLELKQLLAGEQLRRDVLGLITAAGGGLTLADLEQLTEQPPFEIELLLGGVFGRSVGSRTGNPSVGYPDERVYLFTHETLRLVAEQQYGNSLAAYRDRLYAWADSYQQRGWPADTPHYLLRSYPRMIASSGDLPRLVTCATDHVRHDRIRDLTGGDALAFTEISTAQQIILAQPDPDLTGLARLAAERHHLTNRNSNIPTNLPAVWARVGQLTRAEALANSIPNPDRRAGALIQLAEVVTVCGDHGHATRLIGEAEALTAQIAEPRSRASVLVRLALEVGTGGDRERAVRLADEAEALTGQIINPLWRAHALVRLALEVGTGGDRERTVRLADEAELLIGQIAAPDSRTQILAEVAVATAAGGDCVRAEALIGQITDPGRRAEALVRLAEVVAGGDRDRAARLAGEAEAVIEQTINPERREWVLVRLLTVAAVGGDHDRAEVLIEQINDQYPRGEALARLAEAVAAGGDHDWAEVLIGQITHPSQRAEAVSQLAEVAAVGGDRDRAARLAGEAEALTAQNIDLDQRAWMLARLADAVATNGDHGRAEILIGQITDQVRRTDALVRLVEVATAGGHRDRAARLADEAEALTAQNIDLDQRAWMLARLADAVATNGDHGRAEILIGQITDQVRRTDTLVRLVEVATAGGDRDRAARLADETEALIGQITDPTRRVEALARFVEVATAGGDRDRAARLTDETEALVGQITNPNHRGKVLVQLTGAVATNGDYERAEMLVGQITNPSQRAEAVSQLAEVMAASDDQDGAVQLIREAESLIGQIADPDQRWQTLIRLVEVVAGRDHDRAAQLGGEAEVLIRKITNPYRRAQELIRLVEVVAGGDRDGAIRLADEIKALTEQIIDSDMRGSALALLAGKLVRASKKNLLIQEHVRSSSPLVVQARRLLAEALLSSPWNSMAAFGNLLFGLRQVDPLAVIALADELQARWKTNVPTDGEVSSCNEISYFLETASGPVTSEDAD